MVEKYQALGSVFFQTKGDRARYTEARAISQRVGLLFAPSDQEALDWAISQNDNQLLVLELHENLRTAEVISRIHQAHKFALEDSWHWRYDYELFGTSCDDGFFEFGFDILVTNRPESCMQERLDKSKISN